MRRIFLAMLIIMLVSVPVASAQESDLPTIGEILREDENFSTLLEVVQAADMTDALDAEGPITVFAPGNDAFEALPPGMLQGVMSSPPSVSAVLRFHVAEGALLAADIAEMDSIPTLLGAPLPVTVNDAGEILLLDGVKIVTSDIEASNGVIQVIDRVLIPERPGSPSAAAEAGNTVGDVVASRDDLAFLSTALSLSTTIGEALKTESEFTLLAPNDAAFTALDADTRNAAIADPNLLGSILLYHILPDSELVTEESIAELAAMDEPLELETLLPGATIQVSTDEDGNLLVNGAAVVEMNIEADNGVIHIIDTVLLPPEDAILEDLDAYLQELLGSDAAAESSMEEGPALDPNWDPVAGGFGMAELDTADDFFVTVVDPFTNDELYGVQIINWTAEYQYTGYIVEQFLPGEVLVWMGEHDPTTWDNISDETLNKLPPTELAKLPAEVQARVK